MTKKNTGNGDNGSNGNERSGVGKVVTGLMFGSIMGDTVGLWFAPASAEEGKSFRTKQKSQGKNSAWFFF